MKRLRVRMTSMIVLVVLVSTGLLFLLSYQRARDSMSGQMESNYSVVADKYAQELTAWVNPFAQMLYNTVITVYTAISLAVSNK